MRLTFDLKVLLLFEKSKPFTIGNMDSYRQIVASREAILHVSHLLNGKRRQNFSDRTVSERRCIIFY